MKTLFVSLLLGFTLAVSAQTKLPVDVAVQQAYARGTRSVTGQPGTSYWQNTADYDLKIDFDPKTGLLNGKVQVNYQNNSPDTLRQLWLKLYPNLYKKGVPRKSKIAAADLGEGVQITAFQVDSKKMEPGSLQEDGTNLVCEIAPLLPGGRIKLFIDYHYLVNKGSHIRTGKVDDGSWFLAYFFPRVAVYDDIDGWNKYPYTGAEEFYNDFCNFKAEIRVPRNFVVWATGDLQNPQRVLSSSVAARLAQAEKSDQTIDVIGPADLQANSATRQDKFLTYRYAAQNVPDFAFATSDHYLWKSKSLVVDSATGRRTRVDAAFNPTHKDYYEVVDFAYKTVQAMSFTFPRWPYPYAHETVFDGLDQMEYPMMVNDNPVDKREDAITLTTHEIFHTMFPFYMGTNETKYAWMDEGWATIGEWLLSPIIEPAFTDDYGIAPTAQTSGTKNDTPVITPTTQLAGAGSFTNSYPKPALGYLYIREMLGDSLFNKALHHYISTWNGKHPTPHDFFNCMNAGSGRNLNWFWQRWFYASGVTDMGLTAVHKTAAGYSVEVENKSDKPLPVHLRLFFEDGSSTEQRHSVAVWERGDRKIAIPVVTGKRLVKVTMGSTYVPDRAKGDNTFVVTQ
ncbi:peptidase [Pedobacter yulinensis]|uniref:Peptidase n=1 Tax=Pedobacter yulinensis TaxID=2126353 RepID=A0A2T3HKH1_9SPHI|nr:M1 family metallopeptidase [Pedobacter yulinensis]PST82958.1 peptidase [Pedobacter yulinensis]